jgi:hypothetical protein
MLAKIRSGSDSLIVRIILGLIALSFIGVGGASFINGNSQGDAVVFSDTESISQEEFQIAKSREVENIQRQNGINLTDEQVAELGIDYNVLRRLINDSMIKYLARTYDFDISDEKIISFVKRTTHFRNQAGEFDLSVFKSVFNNSPRKEEEYLESIKHQLVSSSMVNVFMNSYTPSKIQNDNMVDYMAETRSIDIVSLNLGYKPKGYKASPISDELLDKFYQSNKDLFVSSELRSFDYIVADNTYLKKKLDISKADLKKYFSENSEDFLSDNFAKVEKQVREALVQEKTEELASELAKNLEEDASSGLKVAEIAKKYGLTVLSQKEISLAEMQGSKKVEYVELADTVFELIDGDVSYPIEIKNQNSIMLVELKLTKALRQKELSEVEGEVKEILAQKALAFENVNALDSLRRTYDSKKNNRNELKAKGISIAVNQSYTRAELPLQDKLPPELLKSMFSMKKGETTQLVNHGKILYFAHVKTVKKSNKKAKVIRENSEEHFSNVAREGVFLELISNLTYKNKMKVLQES